MDSTHPVIAFGNLVIFFGGLTLSVGLFTMATEKLTKTQRHRR